MFFLLSFFLSFNRHILIIIQDTKINKVLKGIIKLASIPSDERFNFKKRATDLLSRMNVVLSDGEVVPATEKTLAVGKEKDTKDIKKAAEEKSSVKVDEAAKETKEVSGKETEAEKKVEEPGVGTGKKEDVEMGDTDGKEAGAAEETEKVKITKGEKEVVEASA